MLDTTEPRFIGVTRRTSLRQALTRCVCRIEGAREGQIGRKSFFADYFRA